MKKIIQDMINSTLEALRNNKRIAAVFLFGSQATNRAREDSDIDIAVLLKKGALDFGVSLFGNEKVEVHNFDNLPLEIQFRVIKEGKVLFVRDKEYLKNIWLKTVREFLDFGPFISTFYRRVIHHA